MREVLTHELGNELLRRLRPLDISLALRVYRGSPLAERPSIEELLESGARLFWLAALVSHAQSQSHSGLSLEQSALLGDLFSYQERDDKWLGAIPLVALLGSPEALLEAFPGMVVTSEALEERPEAVFVVRRTERLVYLQRWYALEAEVGAALRQRLDVPAEALPATLIPRFQRLFASREVVKNPWQAAACLSALRQRFSVITGGPGTGKTTTVTRLVALLLSLPEASRPHNIRMVAPTGKAADRLREAFTANFGALVAGLPREEGRVLHSAVHAVQPPSTVHAFLGSRGISGFSHHEGNPVSCDVLIVDEATMVDLELFAAIFRALPTECRVVLLGDRNQLTAVETGNVFSDLTSTRQGPVRLNVFGTSFRRQFASFAGIELPEVEGPVPICGDGVTELTHSYRFSGDSGVGRVARLLLEEERLPTPGALPVEVAPLDRELKRVVTAAVRDFKDALRQDAGPEVLLRQFNAVRVLCGVRQGEAGVEAVNRMAAEAVLGDALTSVPRHGLPFMIVRNDRALGLWNGDCGVFALDASGALKAFLPADEGALRQLDPFALPEWEPAFAMTIHKSQGSEYEWVVLVLPETRRPFITWELAYTGVTRAKRSITLVMPESLFGARLNHARRISGLVAELRPVQ